MLAMAGRTGDLIATPLIYLQNLLFNIKRKRFFDGYIKQIMKNMVKDLRDILIFVMQTIPLTGVKY